VLVLNAYSFGPWMPQDEADAAFGLILAQKKYPGVKFGLCPLAQLDNPFTADQWSEYLGAQATRLGPLCTMSQLADSSTDSRIVERLGWTTREVTFQVPGDDEKVPYSEVHVVASGDTTGARFVLFGPTAFVEQARKEFRFLLSRLSRPD
jgi:hypothetical protein